MKALTPTAALQARAIEILHHRKCSRLTVARELGITERLAVQLLAGEPLMGLTKGAYSPEQRGALLRKLIALYKTTRSPAAAADAVGVARATAYKWLAAAGMYVEPSWACGSRKSAKISPEAMALSMAAYSDGLSIERAAALHRIPVPALAEALKAQARQQRELNPQSWRPRTPHF